MPRELVCGRPIIYFCLFGVANFAIRKRYECPRNLGLIKKIKMGGSVYIY